MKEKHTSKHGDDGVWHMLLDLLYSMSSCSNSIRYLEKKRFDPLERHSLKLMKRALSKQLPLAQFSFLLSNTVVALHHMLH